jgi:hypothetical protein
LQFAVDVTTTANLANALRRAAECTWHKVHRKL